MKKIYIKLSILLFFIIFPFNINAKNKINNMNVDIYINKDGSATFTETWDVNADDGTEWYKVINGYFKEDVSDFSVYMDNIPLEYQQYWNVNASLDTKKGKYGINETSTGIELCWGKYNYSSHTFIIKYTLNNIMYKVSDADVLYFNIIDTLSNVDFKDFNITVRSYYSFPDTLDVWGFGYKGYAYVKDGIIWMSNVENKKMGEQYAVLLAKFPLNTFTNIPNFKGMELFDDVLNLAEEGSFKHNYSNILVKIMEILSSLISFIIPTLIVFFAFKAAKGKLYGYKNNKIIDKNNTNNFRDIPCNKDIFYADTLLYLNRNLGKKPIKIYKESNILGAIILKWVKEDKIRFLKDENGKSKSKIDLTLNPTFDNEFEKKIFEIMKEASGDGILETKELEKWCKDNYSNFFDLFEKRINENINTLKSDNHIYKRINKEECKYNNVLDDQIYDDSQKLYGLKLFLDEFSNIDTKETIEVKLWDEYLMFAYLFGIADKVSAQLKNLYPEMLEQQNIDYDTIVFVNHISSKSYSSASSARSAAQSYSSGGGGFSSGGGGGGSFGGGGGGSR